MVAESALRLYGYWRSSSSWRVRIALALKQLQWEHQPVHLVRDGGEQHQAGHHARNPQELVPVLEHGDIRLSQSMAICEYLDAHWPTPRLVPADPLGAARVRGLSQLVACEIQPLNNLRVLNYLRDDLQADAEAVQRWYQHWIDLGFSALEESLRGAEAPFAMGDSPCLLDVVLIPQLYNARRFNSDLAAYPRLLAIEQQCLALPAFASTAPEQQPEAGS